jgi:hypothetical protein
MPSRIGKLGGNALPGVAKLPGGNGVAGHALISGNGLRSIKSESEMEFLPGTPPGYPNGKYCKG